MPTITITDIADHRLSRYIDLRTHPSSKEASATFVVEGRLCVIELAKSALTTLSVVVQDGRQDEAASWFDDSVPIYVLTAEQIRALVGFDFHRGILACGVRPDFRSLATLAFGPSDVPIALAVFGVSLYENLGGMIRTASSFGINHLIVGPCTADPYSRRTIRVSMGAVFGQSVYRVNDPKHELRQIAESANVRVVATTLAEDATSLETFRRDDRPIVLIVGSEPDGVGRDVEVAATDCVTIPMRMNRDSLNVSVAAAIFMYELSRT